MGTVIEGLPEVEGLLQMGPLPALLGPASTTGPLPHKCLCLVPSLCMVEVDASVDT